MLELERAQGRLLRASQVLSGDLKPRRDMSFVATALERGFVGIYDAMDHRTPRLTGVQAALDAIAEAERQIAPDLDHPMLRLVADSLGFASRHLTEAHALLAALPEERGPTAAPDLVVSTDVPRLHRVDRPSLHPRILVEAPAPVYEVVPPDITRPKSFDELRDKVKALQASAVAKLAPKSEGTGTLPPPPPEAIDEHRPGFVPDVAPAISELDFVHGQVRECFEEVAMVGMQRAPLFGDPWRFAQILENRMLRAIDRIAGLGAAALMRLEPLVLDSPVKDPSRVFAVGMITGCFGGRDALAVAERIFLDFEVTDPSCRHELGAALKLVPHDLLPLTLRSWLADSDSRHRALAIDVLAYRGLVTEAELVQAAMDEDRLVSGVALPYLALARSKAIVDAIESDRARPLGEDDDLRGRWLAMILSGHRGTPQILAEAIDGPHGDAAAMLLALYGDEGDANRLLERCQAGPRPGLLHAVGWAGDGAAIEPLMAMLDHDDEEIAVAAAFALERLTGAHLIVETEVEVEDIVAPIPPDPDVGETPGPKLVRTVSDPRDLPPEPSTETVERPTTNRSAWQVWWQDEQRDYVRGRRYRHGKPYVPSLSLVELDEGRATLPERRALHWELVVRTGEVVRFDPHDFVVVQEASLAEWRRVAQRGGNPGRWHRPGR
ncbi:MAG: hypothetical protein R3B72_47075 [Polyangiaceae bacterium]